MDRPQSSLEKIKEMLDASAKESLKTMCSYGGKVSIVTKGDHASSQYHTIDYKDVAGKEVVHQNQFYESVNLLFTQLADDDTVCIHLKGWGSGINSLDWQDAGADPNVDITKFSQTFSKGLMPKLFGKYSPGWSKKNVIIEIDGDKLLDNDQFNSYVAFVLPLILTLSNNKINIKGIVIAKLTESEQKADSFAQNYMQDMGGEMFLTLLTTLGFTTNLYFVAFGSEKVYPFNNDGVFGSVIAKNLAPQAPKLVLCFGGGAVMTQEDFYGLKPHTIAYQLILGVPMTRKDRSDRSAFANKYNYETK